MAVVVLLADRHDRDPRSQAFEQLGKTVVGRAVMAYLENLDRWDAQARRHVRLRVGRQKRVDIAIGREQDRGVVVGVVRG